MLAIVLPATLLGGGGEVGGGVGVPGGAALEEADGGAEFDVAGTVEAAAAAFDCVEAEPPHPAMRIADKAATATPAACGGTRRISRF